MLSDEYLNRLVEGSHIELYLSGNEGGRMYWPWRMHPPSVVNNNHRNACSELIVDSDPLNDEVTNKTVLDKAVDVGADVASLQDVYLNKSATVASLLEGLEIYDSHKFNGKLLLPLQEPYTDAWHELGEPKQHLIGIGGLKDSTPAKRLKATRKLRNEVGGNVWIHGFGWSVDGMASEIRENPQLIDSIDYSSPVQSNVVNGATNGDEILSVVAMKAAAKLVENLREVSKFPNEEETKQATLV